MTPAALNRPSLICYVKGDEAKAWLQLVNVVSESPFVANDYLLQFLQTWPVFLVVNTVGFTVDWFIGERSAFFGRGILLIIYIFLTSLLFVVVMTFVMPVVSIVTRAHRAGLGWEGMFAYSVVDLFTTVHPACATGVVVTAIEAQPERRLAKGLRHSNLYLDANIVKSIGDWIERRSVIITRPDSEVHTTPAVPELTRPDLNTVLFRWQDWADGKVTMSVRLRNCILFNLAIILFGCSRPGPPSDVVAATFTAGARSANVLCCGAL